MVEIGVCVLIRYNHIFEMLVNLIEYFMDGIVKATVPRLIWNTKGYIILKGDMNRKPVTHSMILAMCATDLG